MRRVRAAAFNVMFIHVRMNLLSEITPDEGGREGETRFSKLRRCFAPNLVSVTFN